MNHKFFLASMLVGMSLALVSCGSVDSGNRGVMTVYGEVDPKSYPEGLYWYAPWSTDLLNFSARSVRWDSSTQSYTSDLQKATIKYAVTYKPVADAIPKLYKETGGDYANQIVPPVVISVIKNTIGTWNAPDIVAKRDEVSTQMESQIRIMLLNQNLILVNFSILDIAYSHEYEAAVEEKEVATQKAKAEINRTVQVTERGKQQIIAAQAEAEAIRVKSNALSQNPAMIEYTRALRWNGSNASTIYCTSETPCMQVTK
jgi:regulator of protease activity HflC (stomatin/prohibitin superfamily)